MQQDPFILLLDIYFQRPVQAIGDTETELEDEQSLIVDIVPTISHRAYFEYKPQLGKSDKLAGEGRVHRAANLHAGSRAGGLCCEQTWGQRIPRGCQRAVDPCVFVEDGDGLKRRRGRDAREITQEGCGNGIEEGVALLGVQGSRVELGLERLGGQNAGEKNGRFRIQVLHDQQAQIVVQ
jgi:hypothetical protein